MTTIVTRDNVKGFVWQRLWNQTTVFLFGLSLRAETQGDMEVFSVDEQQISSSSSSERILKRPRVDENRGDGSEVPTEQCTMHPTLYCEDGNVVLRCEK